MSVITICDDDFVHVQRPQKETIHVDDWIHVQRPQKENIDFDPVIVENNIKVDQLSFLPTWLREFMILDQTLIMIMVYLICSGSLYMTLVLSPIVMRTVYYTWLLIPIAFALRCRCVYMTLTELISVVWLRIRDLMKSYTLSWDIRHIVDLWQLVIIALALFKLLFKLLYYRHILIFIVSSVELKYGEMLGSFSVIVFPHLTYGQKVPYVSISFIIGFVCWCGGLINMYCLALFFSKYTTMLLIHVLETHLEKESTFIHLRTYMRQEIIRWWNTRSDVSIWKIGSLLLTPSTYVHVKDFIAIANKMAEIINLTNICENVCAVANGYHPDVNISHMPLVRIIVLEYFFRCAMPFMLMTEILVSFIGRVCGYHMSILNVYLIMIMTICILTYYCDVSKYQHMSIRQSKITTMINITYDYLTRYLTPHINNVVDPEIRGHHNIRKIEAQYGAYATVYICAASKFAHKLVGDSGKNLVLFVANFFM